MDCMHVFLVLFFKFLFTCLFVFNREKDLDGWGSGEDLEGDGGGETMIQYIA